MFKAKFKKINDVVVKPCLNIDTYGGDMRPIMGKELFDEIYANIFMAAKKKSGKTQAAFEIIRDCATRETKILVFASTLYKDATFKKIREWAEENKIEFEGFTSLKGENGEDMLKELIPDVIEEEEDLDGGQLRRPNVLDLDETPKPRKPRKPKFRAPKYIILLDDLSDELKKPALTAFLKKNRHSKAKVIISSQYYKDLLPESRDQLDYILAFRNLPEDTLHIIWSRSNLDLPFEAFKKIYQKATEKEYSFLYIDRNDCELRQNFNVRIDFKAAE
jgi:hypothetical protein